jgi:hypothetical protein
MSLCVSTWTGLTQKNEDDQRRLRVKEDAEPGSYWTTKSEAFKDFKQGKLDGFFDTSAGLTYADKVGLPVLDS